MMTLGGALGLEVNPITPDFPSLCASEAQLRNVLRMVNMAP